MAFNSLLDPKQYASWEQDPSTRESIRLLTKAYPVDATLTVSGTAQDLITVAPGLPTVNLITNPSMETADPPTGYTARRTAAVARSNTIAKYGTYSMRLTPPGAAIGEGAYWNLGSWPTDQPLAVSSYFSDNAGGGDTARVELFAATTSLSDVTNVRVALGNTATFAGAGWYRSSLVLAPRFHITVLYYNTLAVASFAEDETITGGTTGATAKVMTVKETNTSGWLVIIDQSAPFLCQKNVAPNTAMETITGGASGATANVTKVVQADLNMCTMYMLFVTASIHGTAFYVDGAQAEANFTVTPYCDGAQGYYHWWDGTAHASTSRRWRKMSSIRSMRLHTTRAVYVAYDQAANISGVNAEDRGEYLPAGTDWGEDHPIYLDSKISFVNAVAGEQPRVYGLIWGI